MNRHDNILDAAKASHFPRFNEEFTNQFETSTVEALDISLELAFVEGAKWADENPQWISVKDELPPSTENISASYLVRTSVITRSMPMGAMYVAGYSKSGFNIYGQFSFTDKITHWMPLPKQPTDL